MRCPVCSEILTGIRVDGVASGICDGGCGGIWFDWQDWMERAVDESQRQTDRQENTSTSHKREPRCPACYDVDLKSHTWDLNEQVYWDQCDKCGGFWIDWSELEKIREICKAKWQKRIVGFDKFCTEFGKGMDGIGDEDKRKLAAVFGVLNRYHYIRPSCFGCDSVEWGVF